MSPRREYPEDDPMGDGKGSKRGTIAGKREFPEDDFGQMSPGQSRFAKPAPDRQFSMGAKPAPAQAVSKQNILPQGHEEFVENQLVRTLQKPPKKRSTAEIDVLQTIALSKAFFSNFLAHHGAKNLRELLKQCYYE